MRQNLPWALSIEGPVVSITKFGAFVQLAEGVEGMVHISEISADKRINHPQEVLRLGQLVQGTGAGGRFRKRQLRLSMKQLVPTGLDEYIAEHKVGDVVTGRIMICPVTMRVWNWAMAFKLHAGLVRQNRMRRPRL